MPAQAYEQAIAANDGYASAHCNLGVLLDLYLDDPKAALPEFERYKALTARGQTGRPDGSRNCEPEPESRQCRATDAPAPVKGAGGVR